MGTTRCSDRRHTGRLVTLEGMPGAGKTTLITALAARGLQTVGEYVTDDGATLAWQHRPAVDDDQAHQRNWILKHRVLTASGGEADAASVG
jgi:predicted ATPase